MKRTILSGLWRKVYFYEIFRIPKVEGKSDVSHIKNTLDLLQYLCYFLVEHNTKKFWMQEKYNIIEQSKINKQIGMITRYPKTNKFIKYYYI